LYGGKTAFEEFEQAAFAACPYEDIASACRRRVFHSKPCAPELAQRRSRISL